MPDRTPVTTIAPHAPSPPGEAGVLRVRPLPSSEPAPGPVPGAPPHPVAARGGSPTPVPDAAREPAIPVPARRSAHALVRMALEVVDRHRPPHQTRGVFPEHLVEMLRTLARQGVPGQDLGRARIHRVHVNAAGAPPVTGDGSGRGGDDDDDADGAREYEVCATYARGPRLFALAARIRVTDTTASCSALRLI